MKQLSWIVLLLTISTFSQTPGGGVTDIDGNRYNSVIIGTQEWMKENLNVSKYSDGTIIPQVTDPTQWANLTTGAWCYYNNDPANGAIYGKLYNWYAVAGIHDNDPNTPNKVLAPTGWIVPFNIEWNGLINFLGGPLIAGGAMKAICCTSAWNNSNSGNNSSNFTGLPGGTRDPMGPFQNFGEYGHWNSNTESNGNNGNVLMLYKLITNLTLDQTPKTTGASIRCIKNSTLNNQTFNNNSFNIYPNPAKDQITIDLGTNSNAIGWSYKIVNTLGQEVLNGVLSSQQNIIALNNIKGQGVYFVKVYNGSNALLDTKKIIIQQ